MIFFGEREFVRILFPFFLKTNDAPRRICNT